MGYSDCSSRRPRFTAWLLAGSGCVYVCAAGLEPNARAPPRRSLPDGRYRGKIWVRTSEDGVAYSAPNLVAEYLSYGEAGGDRRWKGLGATPMAEDRRRGRHAP